MPTELRDFIDRHPRLFVLTGACCSTDSGIPDYRDAAMAALQKADAMFVIGSPLMVYSGYRFVRAAHEAGTSIAAVNLGRTRADHLLTLKVTEPCAQALHSV